MKYSVFAVEDTVAKKFLHLFVEDNQATAVRAFKQWCSKIEDPRDFRLWFVGFWDIYSGQLSGEQNQLVVEGAVE